MAMKKDAEAVEAAEAAGGQKSQRCNASDCTISCLLPDLTGIASVLAAARAQVLERLLAKVTRE